MNALQLFTPQSFEFAKLLIEEKSADLHIKTYSGDNCFHQLARIDPVSKYSRLKFSNFEQYLAQKRKCLGLYKDFFDLLVKNGIDINEKNFAGWSPLSMGLREGNHVFVDLLTREAGLQVDRLVRDESELHSFHCYIFQKNSPQILSRILEKSQDFKLLMSLYNTDNGYNAFHSVLSEVVMNFTGRLNSIRSKYSGKYHSYLRYYNRLKQSLFEREGRPGATFQDDDDTRRDGNCPDGIAEERPEESPLGEQLADLKKELKKIKKKLKRNVAFEAVSEYFRIKSQMYQHKFHAILTEKEQEQLKRHVKSIFQIFEKSGYDLGQKVRLYKKKINQPSIAQNTRAVRNRGSQGSRIRWRNKNYTINVEAKNTVFHILMKKANLFLFEYFAKRVNIKKNENNFLGYSLIHYLLKHYQGSTPQMDLKIYNDDYDIMTGKPKYKPEKKAKPQSSQLEATSRVQPQTSTLFAKAPTFSPFAQPQPGLFSAPGVSPQMALNPVNPPFSRTSSLFGGPNQMRGGLLPKRSAGFKPMTFGRETVFGSKSKFGTNNELRASANRTASVTYSQELETLKILKRLLNMKESPDLHNKDKEYPIIRVCQSGGNRLLHMLVQNNANLNVVDSRGNTPLLIFAKKRDLKSCEYLLENGADIQLTDNKERNALHWALNQIDSENSNNFDLEETLIDKGVGVNQKDAFGRPPIFYLFSKVQNEFIARKFDPIEMFSYMISLKTLDLEQVDYLGNRLIHYLAKRGSYMCMIYLLRKGVQHNVLNTHQNSPLNISIADNQNDVAIILLQREAEVNIPIQEVDYQSMKRYQRMKRARENEQESSRAIEQEREEESGQEEAELLIENEDGLIEENIATKFKEDSESENEDNWREYVQSINKRSKRSKRTRRKAGLEVVYNSGMNPIESADESSRPVASRTNQSRVQWGQPQQFKMGIQMGGFGHQKAHQSMGYRNRKTAEERESSETEWDRLVKMAETNFVRAQASQFKVALRNAMSSVNFLLVDFNFNLGLAIMDTISLQNWDYTKTLLNKKGDDESFQTVDNKGRNVMHYLANFGQRLGRDDLSFFLNKFSAKGIQMGLKDCLDRKPFHYAALKGNLAFIQELHRLDKDFHEKDIFGNTLLSLYVRFHSVSGHQLAMFIREFANDVNLEFIISGNPQVKRIESFEYSSASREELREQLSECLVETTREINWFDIEMKFRGGQTVPQLEKPSLERYSILMYAAWVKKDLVLTEELIRLGADVNAKDWLGETIFLKAIKQNHLKMIELMKKYSAQIDFSTGKESNRSRQQPADLPAPGREPLLLGQLPKSGFNPILGAPVRLVRQGPEWPNRSLVRRGPQRRPNHDAASLKARLEQQGQATLQRGQSDAGQSPVDRRALERPLASGVRLPAGLPGVHGPGQGRAEARDREPQSCRGGGDGAQAEGRQSRRGQPGGRGRRRAGAAVQCDAGEGGPAQNHVLDECVLQDAAALRLAEEPVHFVHQLGPSGRAGAAPADALFQTGRSEEGIHQNFQAEVWK